MMMNQYDFLAELSRCYPAYIKHIKDPYFIISKTTKNICEDIGFNGSYLKLHNYNLITDYDYKVIIDYIEENEEVKNMLLFYEL